MGPIRAELIARFGKVSNAAEDAERLLRKASPCHVDAETRVGVWTRLTVHSYEKDALYRVTNKVIEPPGGV